MKGMAFSMLVVLFCGAASGITIDQEVQVQSDDKMTASLLE